MFMSIIQFQEVSIFVDACSVTQNPQLNNFQSQAVFVWIWSNWSRHMAGNSEHILLLPLPRTSWVPHILSCSNSEINWLQIGLVTHTHTNHKMVLIFFFWNIYIKDHLFNIQILQDEVSPQHIYLHPKTIHHPGTLLEPFGTLASTDLRHRDGSGWEFLHLLLLSQGWEKVRIWCFEMRIFWVDANMFMHFVAEVQEKLTHEKKQTQTVQIKNQKLKHHQSSWIFLGICAG